MQQTLLTKLLALPMLIAVGLCALLTAQTRGSRTIYGDLLVDESSVPDAKALIFDVVLYNEARVRLDHQIVGNKGRYRFDVPSGIYDIVVESEGTEVARVRVEMLSPLVTTFRRDIELELRPKPGGERKIRSGVVSAADLYKRDAANEKLFGKAQEAVDKKDYPRAIALFQQLVGLDAADYQSWTELGTVYLLQGNTAEAEKSYQRAIAIQPAYLLALMDLGRLRLATRNFEGAIEVLTQAVSLKSDSPEANYYLGEGYLQIKKGSKAVGYLSEALRLDPVGMAEAHLRLAALYNGAGLKGKAAAEYEQFLKKKPGYPDRKKLEQYISANKEH